MAGNRLAACRVSTTLRQNVCRPFRASPSATRFCHHHRHIPELTSGFSSIDSAYLIAQIKRHGFCPHLYADDMHIYGSCQPQAIHDLQLHLSACIDDVHNWMQSICLQLKTNKTELLWCGTAGLQHQLTRSACRIGTDDIIPSTTMVFTLT